MLGANHDDISLEKVNLGAVAMNLSFILQKIIINHKIATFNSVTFFGHMIIRSINDKRFRMNF